MPNRKKYYRDMDKFARTRRKQKRKYYAKTSNIYEKRAWTSEEERLVMEHSMTDTELSETIQRSVAAIQKRRCLLKEKVS